MYLMYGWCSGVSASVNDVHAGGDKGWQDEAVPLLGGITKAATGRWGEGIGRECGRKVKTRGGKEGGKRGMGGRGGEGRGGEGRGRRGGGREGRGGEGEGRGGEGRGGEGKRGR